MTVKNTGTATWPAGGSNPVHLGIHFAKSGGGYPVNYPWATDQRFTLPYVAPGQSVTFNVAVSPPSSAGSYILEYQMVQEYVA